MSYNGWLGKILHKQKLKYQEALASATPEMLRWSIRDLTREMDDPKTTDARIDEIALIQDRLRTELKRRGLNP